MTALRCAVDRIGKIDNAPTLRFLAPKAAKTWLSNTAKAANNNNGLFHHRYMGYTNWSDVSQDSRARSSSSKELTVEKG